MTEFRFSRHAEDRLRQRGIPPIIVELLDRFGATERCGGAEKLFFNKRSRQRLLQHFGGARSLRVVEPWLDAFVVLSDDGAVVTVGHRQKRVYRE